MDLKQLQDDAADCLSKAFKANQADACPQPHVLHAAVSVLLLKEEQAGRTPRQTTEPEGR